jgi:MFS family permease
MPLKHQTETALVVLLGAAMALAGIVIAVLSWVSSPWLLWIAAFFIAVAYPLILYPHFRERRADYEFRLLHFAPALFLLVWMALTILSSVVPGLFLVRAFLTFAWALPLVIIGFALLAWFCLNVLRQWPKRLVSLAAILLPFALLGLFGQRFEWNRHIASVIDSPTGSGSVSSGPIAAASARSGVSIVSRGTSSNGVIGQNPPPHLPHAGGGIEFFALLVPAATSAAVHLRAMRRSRAS